MKPAAWPFVGKLEVAPEIGLVPYPFETEVSMMVADDFSGFPPPRPVAGHKGTFGRLAIIAGSPGYHGAAVLAARGAQRAQPGLITLYTTETVYQPVAAQLQAVMVGIWRPNLKLPGDHSAILIGPGLAGDLPDIMKRTARLLWQLAPVPLVVDASALDWLADAPPPPENALRVVTPHPGEAARLLGCAAADVQADRRTALREISRRLGNCWVVLK